MICQFGLMLMAGVFAARAAEYRFDLSSTPLDESPTGFRSAVTGEGRPGDWKIILADFPSELAQGAKPGPTNRRKVLAQTAQDSTDNHFPILIYDREIYDDFKFQTRFKTVSGKVEQMAGIAFRIQDEKNYFVLRVSALGNNIAFYPMKDGRINSSPVARRIEIQSDAWHTLSVECVGNKISCQLDGAAAFPELQDSTFAKGKVGFWTKSDAVSYFADASITYTPRERFAEILVRDMKSKYPRVLGLKVSAYTGARHDKFSVVASSNPGEIGKDADPVENEVISHSTVYYGKGDRQVTVAIPIHDRNGDVVASVRILMKSFPGQTEVNALARAMPIAKEMEERLQGGRDLMD